MNHRAVQRLDTARIDLFENIHIAEDIAQLPAEQVYLILANGETGKLGHMQDILPGNGFLRSRHKSLSFPYFLTGTESL